MLKSVMLIPLMIFITALGGCQSASIYGSGPVKLSRSVEGAYETWKQKDAPITFAITEDGKSGSFTSCDYGFQCVEDTYAAVSRCESRTGKKCFVFAEYGKIVWEGYQSANTGRDENASFSVKSLDGETIYSGRITNPGSGETFSLYIGNGNYCQGLYKTSSTFTVQLDCGNDSRKGDIKKGNYKGEMKYISWAKGSKIDLKAPGLRLLEMNINPYNGVILSDNS